MALASIDISDLTKGLKKDLGRFERDCIPAAERAALLRAANSARSRWVKGVAKQTRIKQKLIRTRSANRRLGRDGRMITMNGAPMPVVVMGPKGKVPNQTKKGVRIAGRHYPDGFVASARFGKRVDGKSIFRREGKGRGPLDEMREDIQEAVQRVGPVAVRRAIQQRYPKEFEWALERELKKRTRFRQSAMRSRVQTGGQFAAGVIG